MSQLDHFRLMAEYNSRMNEQVFTAALKFDEDFLQKDLGAFFKSINGTLNHILVGDIIWFTRFSSHSEKFTSLVEISEIAQPVYLNEILFGSTSELYNVRKRVDGLIEKWTINEIDAADLQRGLTYNNTKGIRGRKLFGELLSHVFNHQTHHRGQISTMLNQNGADIGITDFLLEIPDLT
ncbi:MAG: DinB family protein [Alteromonadaceae bacterium]|nr:DinB family protein [Alteromonadaceae bacterium]